MKGSIKPVRPVKPSKIKIKKYSININDCKSLEEILREVPDNKSLSEVSISFNLPDEDWAYDEDAFYNGKLYLNYFEEIQNSQYEKELKTYNKKLITYKNKLRKYKEDKKEFKQIKIAKLEQQLAKLKE